MKAEDIDLMGIVTDTTREGEFTKVEISFEKNDITITGSVFFRADSDQSTSDQLTLEREAQDKILTYFGLSKEAIESLHYD